MMALITPPIPSPAINPAAIAKPPISNDFGFLLFHIVAAADPITMAVPSTGSLVHDQSDNREWGTYKMSEVEQTQERYTSYWDDLNSPLD
jgi:hypothetical protein